MGKMMILHRRAEKRRFGADLHDGREGQGNLIARARRKNKQNINVVNFSFFIEKTGIFEGYIIIMKETS